MQIEKRKNKRNIKERENEGKNMGTGGGETEGGSSLYLWYTPYVAHLVYTYTIPLPPRPFSICGIKKIRDDKKVFDTGDRVRLLLKPQPRAPSPLNPITYVLSPRYYGWSVSRQGDAIGPAVSGSGGGGAGGEGGIGEGEAGAVSHNREWVRGKRDGETGGGRSRPALSFLTKALSFHFLLIKF
jgi:hypothetical protein